MKSIQKILCPVDMSQASLGAIDIATQLAKQNDAKIRFFHVASQWLTKEAMVDNEYARETVEAEKLEFERLRPSDAAVEFEHLFERGNAGPEIVRATKSADMVVLSSHGRSSLMRLIMGSVAQYVLRNSKCPVVLVQGIATPDIDDPFKQSDDQIRFVTEAMHQVKPIRAFDKMSESLANLKKAGETAAPVVNASGRCIGILTSSDVDQYYNLLERFAKRDESVVGEMFETDKYGHRRTSNQDFDQVKRHMTKEVVSVRNSQSIEDAIEMFGANPNIHHLVVLDDDHHCVGIVDSSNVILTDTAREKITS